MGSNKRLGETNPIFRLCLQWGGVIQNTIGPRTGIRLNRSMTKMAASCI